MPTGMQGSESWMSQESPVAQSGTYHALQAGDVCFGDEEDWVGYMVIQSLEVGAFIANRAAHYGLVCWGKNTGRSTVLDFSLKAAFRGSQH